MGRLNDKRLDKSIYQWTHQIPHPPTMDGYEEFYMKFKIKSYDSIQMIHHAEDESGKDRLIDFFVDGSLDRRFTKPESIIGKTVEVEWLHPYQEIANNIKIIK